MSKLFQIFSKFKKLFNKYVIATVIVVIVLSVGGYFGFKQYEKKYYADPKIMTLSDEQRQNYEKRKQEIFETLKEFPDYFELYLELFQIDRNLGNYQQAINHNKLATKIIKTSSAPYMNIGVYLVELGHYQDAEYYFKKAVKLTPDYYLVYQKLGDLYRNYYKKGTFDKAVKVYQDGITATNDDRLVKDFADYLSENGYKNEALKYYKQLEEVSPEDEMLRELNKQLEESLK